MMFDMQGILKTSSTYSVFNLQWVYQDGTPG